jgi:Flp pilus assembly protein TadD
MGLAAAGLAAPLAAQNPAPDSDTSSYHQAFLNYKAGNYPAARIAIDDAQKESPDNINTIILKAKILTELGDFAGARQALSSLNDNPHLTPADGDNRTLALADLCLRKRDFDGASKCYESLLGSSKANDPDIELKLVYARIGSGDSASALTIASKLRPFDPVNPAYYFAKAALAVSSGDSTSADQDIETVRTIYGITTANRYLKTYLAVFSHPAANNPNARSEPPKESAGAPPNPPPNSP